MKKSQDLKISAKRNSGFKGLETRERVKWIRHTKNLAAKLNGVKSPSSFEELAHFIAEYVSHESGLKDPEAKKENKFFLETLSKGLLEEQRPSDILETLREWKYGEFLKLTPAEKKLKTSKMDDCDRESLRKKTRPDCLLKFPAVTEETVSECVSLLRIALDQKKDQSGKHPPKD